MNLKRKHCEIMLCFLFFFGWFTGVWKFMCRRFGKSRNVGT